MPNMTTESKLRHATEQVGTLYGAVRCLAERLALKGDAVFAYKICEEAGVEPPANVKREIEGDANHAA